MKKLKNPFLLTGYFGKKYFCDRESELSLMMEHFDNERNMVIYSWRRLGKTALIKHFLSTLEKKGKTETLYVDLLGTRELGAAIRQITQAVYERYGKTSTGISAPFRKLLGRIGVELTFDPVSGIPKFYIGTRQSELPERSLEALGEFLNARKAQVVVALDEFQQISHYPNDTGEAVFRSWMQSFPGVRFVFSGSHRNMMASMFAEKNRPFYRSAQFLQLNPIELPAYKKFIKNHFDKNGKTINDEDIDAIYKWSRKQTYCIQLVCNKLYGRHDKVTTENLSPVYQEILEQESPVFANYTNLLTKTQWNVLMAIAKEEPLSNPLSKDFIHTHGLGAASSVSTALKMLQKAELVIKEKEKYCLHDILLARWLQRL